MQSRFVLINAISYCRSFFLQDRDDLPDYCAARYMLENIDRNAEDVESLKTINYVKDSLATVYSGAEMSSLSSNHGKLTPIRAITAGSDTV